MKRLPGRPALDPTTGRKSADVHLSLTALDFDDADRLARRRRESLQDMIRRGLRKLIDDERGS